MLSAMSKSPASSTKGSRLAIHSADLPRTDKRAFAWALYIRGAHLLTPIHFASIWKSPATPSAQIARSVSAERNVEVGQYWAAVPVPQQWCGLPVGSLVPQSPVNGLQSSVKELKPKNK